jgi:hypothetical protein
MMRRGIDGMDMILKAMRMLYLSINFMNKKDVKFVDWNQARRQQ